MNDAIKIQNLTKSYGNHTVLKGISLSIRKGEIFALLGTNGAGKTTALECMEGLRLFDSGSITINGKTGIQLQSSALPACIRPMEALTLFARWHKKALDPALLDHLGIGAFGRTQYARLSTGQKRRLMLALALVGSPDILFLDEPTAGLDVEGRQALHEQIRSLKNQGKTIILASHDMAEVETLCDRIAILKEGNIVFCGTAGELTARIGGRYTIHLKTDRSTELHTTDSIADTLLVLLEDCRQKGLTVLDLRIDRGTLEQHFLSITKETGKQHFSSITRGNTK